MQIFKVLKEVTPEEVCFGVSTAEEQELSFCFRVFVL